MSWLNTPIAIVENDVKTIERMYFILAYRREVTWVTTRYVGCNYTGACAKRDELLEEYPVTYIATDPSVDVSVQSAGAGQYHVIATVKTTSAWTAET